MKFGFASVPGSSAGIKIYRLGLALDKFWDPLEFILALDVFEKLLVLGDV